MKITMGIGTEQGIYEIDYSDGELEEALLIARLVSEFGKRRTWVVTEFVYWEFDKGEELP